MNLFKNKTSGADNDRLAASLARKIVKFQRQISGRLNRWFNAFSINQKKRVVIIFGSLIAAVLIGGLFYPSYTIPKLSQNYSSAHIGQASDTPKPQLSKRQLTDSLTKRK
ncbi:hypothetical protein HK413_05125 [Mucilaginibacter sp. S1162]|uniref:Uncharacterized protein n=1 Tax=Mucilaginibacter humi TaxID=2732510 RepID=A0ABX1W358_9SPHI|nr:hypothetical protein [Mucilaginibacter humi]NNU33679.1 hypothetical protein [Mucilaginibacter humi]